MIKFIIVIGQKYFFIDDAQSSYGIIQIILLTNLLKDNNETKEYSKIVTTAYQRKLQRKV